ncbi:MAG: cyclic nucleotide-binding domain-containing protein, partial [Pseudomonadota bacterium]|nr:cyclic nucleotide-binding domain-containing protein [Pseudomonadota bacterium]
MRVKADVEILEQVALFAGCDKTHLQILAFSSTRVQLPEGRVLFKKGTNGAAGFVVLEGEANLFDDVHGVSNLVARIAGREFLGELSMITDAAYTVTVRAATELAAQRIDRELFLRVAAEFPEFSLKVMKNLSSKLDRSVAQ